MCSSLLCSCQVFSLFFPNVWPISYKWCFLILSLHKSICYYCKRFAQSAGPWQAMLVFRIFCCYKLGHVVHIWPTLGQLDDFGFCLCSCDHVCLAFHLPAPFRTPLLLLWVTFWSHFCHLGVTFGSLGWIFWVKKQTGAPKVPQETPKWNRRISTHLFRHHFEVIFWRFLIFYQKSMCFFFVFSRLCFCSVSGAFSRRWKP